MKILVTGGKGFLGKTLVPILQKKYGRNNVIVPSSIELNLLNKEKTYDLLNNEKFDTVIHLAAKMSGIGELLKNPQIYLEENLIINFNIVTEALRTGVKKFIALGSSCGYNNNTPIPMKEEYFWHLKPENTYGICKLILLEHLMSQKSMEWVYLVPANLYGPNDHFGDTNAHIIPATIGKFLSAKENGTGYIDVWGDGSQVRDFMYVDDAAQIISDSIDNKAFCGKAVNISTNKGNTIKEVVEAIGKSLNLQEIEIRWDTAKPTGIMKKILSNDLLMSIYHEHNSFVNINTGIDKTIRWYSENFHV